jgi:hypothetical protein
MRIKVGCILRENNDMQKKWLFCCCLIIYSLLGTLESNTVDEFTVPKKKGKQSVNALKKNNAEACTELFSLTASLVQEIGSFQEQLINALGDVLEHDDRPFHQDKEQKLRKALEHAHRMQALLAESRKCLVS